jgi:hypothetical protein
MTNTVRRLLLLALISLALVTACSGAHSGTGSSPVMTATGTPAGSGTLHGHLYGVGGPAPGSPRPFSGTITVSGNGTSREAKVGSDGAYSVTIPPGRYTVIGHSPHYSDGVPACPGPNSAQVSNGGTTTMDAYCQMK